MPTELKTPCNIGLLAHVDAGKIIVVDNEEA